MEKDEVIKILKNLKKDLKEKYNIKGIGIFGSLARGEQKETSDIDILVEFGENADLFNLVGLAIFLEGKLNRKVDVVPKKVLREEIRESVLKEVVSL